MSILTEIFMGKNWNLQIEIEIAFKCNLSMKEKYIKKDFHFTHFVSTTDWLYLIQSQCCERCN